jgi:hypothetical protein
MKFLIFSILFSLSSFAMAEDQIYIGKTLEANKDCSATIIDIKMEEDGVKKYLIKTSFTGHKLRKLSNLVMTRKGLKRYVVSEVIVDNSFTEDSKERISLLIHNNDVATVVYEKGKKKNICRILN